MSKAFLLGLMMASPIGPVGLLCLNKNAHPDRYRGLCAAAGMALAYGGVSFAVLFGLKWVSGFLETYRYGLEIVAGILLIAMGWTGFRNVKSNEELKGHVRRRKRDYFGDFSSLFIMTFFNPVPFATFTIVLTTLKILKGQLDLIVEIEFALLVMLGTMVFWVAVNQLLHFVNKRATSNWCAFISRFSALAMIAVGIVFLGIGINTGIRTQLKKTTQEVLRPSFTYLSRDLNNQCIRQSCDYDHPDSYICVNNRRFFKFSDFWTNKGS